MEIQFCGAAQTVTGSMHLIRVNGKAILLDCGLFQGNREQARVINREFLFDPHEIDAVILSHAHIDHAGLLPRLVRQGFDGVIYSTHATRDLCAIMLADSAMIQQKDAEYLKKHGRDVYEPLYTINDVSATLDLFQTIGYHRTFDVVQGVSAKFFDAGHILGSAVTLLTMVENGKTVRLCFTGDVGRPNRPILRDPEFPGDADYIITESTYGGKLHDEKESLQDGLLRVVRQTIERGGRLIIPAFSVGRTQDIVYHLNTMYNEHTLKKIPVYVDSPLSFNATHIYRMHHECYDEEIRNVLLTDDDAFGFKTLTYTRSVDQSKKINETNEPCIVIASSGMCESGRILHHLKNCVSNPNNTLLIVGFMAENTLGRKLVSGVSPVNIWGTQHIVRCHIEKISGLSAHADENELLTYLSQFSKTTLQQTFLVHGELSAQTILRRAMNEHGFSSVSNPEKGTKVQL